MSGVCHRRLWAGLVALVLVPVLLLASGAHAQQPTPPQRQPPPAKAVPKAAEPPKIFGLPRVGEGGATAEDVELLQRAARKFLDDGRCSRIDYGDRSMSRPGWYIISCDGRNIAFTREDIER